MRRYLLHRIYDLHCEPSTSTSSESVSAPVTTFSTVASVTRQPSSTVAPTSSPALSTSLGNSLTTVSSSFAKVDGLKFNIDGETKYFAGTNSYWLPFQTNDADVDSVFKNLKESGLKILRVWGFNDVNTVPAAGTVYFQLHDKATGTATINTGADGLQRLDYVVSAAEKYGIKLIIPFVNSWNDYGGFNAYVTAYGGNKTEWYTNEKIQSVYQAYIKAVVSRYKNSTAIFAWELANEPRCSGCETGIMANWVAKTSSYIKSLDSNHMVTTGEEGMGLTVGSDGSYPYSTSEGGDFAKNLAAPNIDFGVFHLYVADWGITDNSWGNGWIEAHAKICDAAGKPCLFEEYGIKNDHCSDSLKWQKTALTTTGNAADLFWQYGEQLSSGPSPNDDYTIYYGTDDWKCAVADHVSQI
ncbi:Glycoside hydrolase, superfamily [Penicillium expansum]|uniref:mannan endo-1,4-beta-mannosidase n=1 Tax=Penicillium expansum TaxID=27334 RepID=A0A0A2JPV9_PENEN|nr:Glycoside hydrolase, superfamily [Penicillium expansum]KGO43874.1 Glycoside hydrolase, superfamily [Penicillium expansum]KGO57472.1 Glycoside hydrolase, superfamily [Penicillium expansum]KGO73570.1 Glycoside hydrolase, superfamily [Penicillium expansum]